MNSFASVFKCTKEVGILPCAHLDFFPREHAVVAWRQTFEMEMASRVSRRCAIEIETTSSSSIGNEDYSDVRFDLLFFVLNRSIRHAGARADRDIERCGRLMIQTQ